MVESRDQRDDAGRRLQEVLDAATVAAATILEEAEEQARQRVEEARERADRLTVERVREMSELTDRLFEPAVSVTQHSDALLEALDEAISHLRPVPEIAPEPRASPAAAPLEPAEPPRPAREGPAAASGRFPEGAGRAEAAKLVATQMAIGGSSRGEIEARLRRELGIEDPAAILDGVIGV